MSRGLSLCKMPWSPAKRDPRFSRRTPDNILARIKAANKRRRVTGAYTSWLGHVFHGKARKSLVYDAERKKLLAVLEKLAEKAEAEEEPTGQLDSPAPSKAASAAETQVLRPQQRAHFSGEGSEDVRA